jgi:hypothetical protein
MQHHNNKRKTRYPTPELKHALQLYGMNNASVSSMGNLTGAFNAVK